MRRLENRLRNLESKSKTAFFVLNMRPDELTEEAIRESTEAEMTVILRDFVMASAEDEEYMLKQLDLMGSLGFKTEGLRDDLKSSIDFNNRNPDQWTPDAN